MPEPKTASISVLVVDDNAAVCEAMLRWLTLLPWVRWAAAQTDWTKAADDAKARGPDVILLDIDLAEKDGLELIDPLRAACPTARVVVLSGLVRRQFVNRALDHGAAGYILKDQEPSQLASLILQAVEGRTVLCGGTLRYLALSAVDPALEESGG